jgi:uncharacterized protein
VKKDNPDFTNAEIFIISLLEEKLSPTLIYHNKEHTMDVLGVAMQIAESENISADEIKLLRMAVLFHDAGFIYVYKMHEEKSCEMVREYLPAFHFSPEQISLICEMIMATKVPQAPMTKLDQIIADADLDYLGRDDVFTTAQKLYEEMKLNHLLPDDRAWIPFQVKFLIKHNYFTNYSLEKRAPNKELYLKKIMEKLNQ